MAARAPSTQQIIRVFLTITGLCAVLYVAYLVRSVIFLVAIAMFVAMALGPVVDLLCRARIPRSLSILLVYLTIAAGIVGIGTLFVPPLVSGVRDIANNAPHYLAQLRQDPTLRQYDNRYHITQKVQAEAAKLPQQLGQSAGALSNVTVGVFSAIFQLITVLTIAFFFLLDGQRLFNSALAVARPNQAARLATISAEIYRSVAGYVAGNLAISVIAGVVSLVTLVILGVPFAVPLAVLMAFFDLIPLVGATIGAIIVGLVTLFTDFPTATIVWAVVQLIYQQIESSVLVPVVYRRTVNVSPLLTIVAVLMGAQLLGILGALMAIPVAGAIQIIGHEIWQIRVAATDPKAGDAVTSTS